MAAPHRLHRLRTSLPPITGLRDYESMLHSPFTPTTRCPSTITGTRVQELRIRAGASRRTIADHAGIHVTNLARIERGEVNPSLGTLVRIADALGTSVADLVRDVQPS